MKLISKWLSFIKFSHTIFALPFALIGFFLGYDRLVGEAVVLPLGDAMYENKFSNKNYILLFFLVVACMVFARSAAMAFNRYLDRHIDAKNPRTKIREIPSGALSAGSALAFTITCCLLFIGTTFFINPICFYLSPVAIFVVLFYSYTKRFTPLCHLVLGLGLSLAPIGAYLALVGVFAWLPLLFSFIVLCWVSGFDIIYALQDEAFDKENNLYSIPSVLGKAKALNLSITLHLFCGILVVIAGVYGNFGWMYWAGALAFCLMLLYQHSIVKPHDLSKVNIAFMTANGTASLVFGAFCIADILLL